MTHSISLIAPAKLNLNLSINEKLKNGYHSFESDICFLDLHDVINIEISDLNSIEISDKSTFILKDESISALKVIEILYLDNNLDFKRSKKEYFEFNHLIELKDVFYKYENSNFFLNSNYCKNKILKI